MPENEPDVKLRCAECGARLEMRDRRVMPCERCSDAVHDAAYNKGYEEGDAEHDDDLEELPPASPIDV